MKTGICVLVLMLATSVAAPAAEPASASAPASSASDAPTVDILDIIGRVAKRTGKQFVIDPRIRGPVPITGLDLQRVDYPRLLAILRVNQYVAYEANGVVNVLPDANSRQLPIPVTHSVDPKTLDDELVTVVLNLKYACSMHLVPVLRPLMPQAAHMAAYPQTNSMLLNDHADNTRRILDIIDKLEKQAQSLKQQGCTDSPAKSN